MPTSAVMGAVKVLFVVIGDKAHGVSPRTRTHRDPDQGHQQLTRITPAGLRTLGLRQSGIRQ